MRPAHRTGLALLALAACASQDNLIEPGDALPSRAFGTWHPGPHDTCTQEQHDAYSVIGPDGKAYPTWHPPTGPGGCSFGHEHGRDPSGSDLYADLDGLPFGYANEMRALEDPANPRDEDHVGHKVEWENDRRARAVGRGHHDCDDGLRRPAQAAPGHPLEGRLHQQSPRAGLSRSVRGRHRNPRDLARGDRPTRGVRTQLRADRARRRRVTHTRQFPGGLRRQAYSRPHLHRALHARPPGRAVRLCVGPARELAGLQLGRAGRRARARVLQSLLPGRSAEPILRPRRWPRPWVGRSTSATRSRRPASAQSGGPCAASTGSGTVAGLAFDDPRSLFNGTSRSVDINAIRVSNPGGPAVWYTDALGHRGSPTPFRGSIRQVIASVDRYIGVDIGGPTHRKRA